MAICRSLPRYSGRSPRHYVPRDDGAYSVIARVSRPVAISRHCEAVKPWQSVVRCLVTAVDPHVTAFLGMTVVVIVIARVARPVAICYSVGIKSRHVGLIFSINSTLRCRDQLLICFSLAIADIIVG